MPLVVEHEVADDARRDAVEEDGGRERAEGRGEEGDRLAVPQVPGVAPGERRLDALAQRSIARVELQHRKLARLALLRVRAPHADAGAADGPSVPRVEQLAQAVAHGLAAPDRQHRALAELLVLRRPLLRDHHLHGRARHEHEVVRVAVVLDVVAAEHLPRVAPAAPGRHSRGGGGRRTAARTGSSASRRAGAPAPRSAPRADPRAG